MRNPPFVLLLALIWAQLALKCSARIGETREQCDQRYGAPTGGKKDVVYYLKNEILILVRFANGVCSQIVYAKADQTSFSAEELKELLVANSLDGKRTWKLFKENVWTSDDDYAAAVHENGFFIQPKPKTNPLQGF